MTMVGIIANPASGKDIRRLVTQAMVVGNRQKTSIVRSILIGLHSTGIRDVRIMPDTFGIGEQALHDLRGQWDHVISGVSILDMQLTNSEIDTVTAARMLVEAGAGCMIVLGGDGTIRAVAKACKETPILPVSTGTNNVMPQFVDGTIAGMAGGWIAQQETCTGQELCYRSKRIDVIVEDQIVDLALVDVAAVVGNFTGSRAVWEASTLRQIAVTRASPSSIGLSAVVGLIQPVSTHDPFGMVTTIGPGGLGWSVSAPVGPGLVSRVPIQEIKMLMPNQPHSVVAERPLILTLDGEREIRLREGQAAAVVLQTEGPWIVQVERVMERATQTRWFLQ